jgi:hypothetical protein
MRRKIPSQGHSTQLRRCECPILISWDRAFREAKTATFQESLARLQQASGPAVTRLLKILVDPNAQQAVKARCAYYILDQTGKATETEEIEVRVGRRLKQRQRADSGDGEENR